MNDAPLTSNQEVHPKEQEAQDAFTLWWDARPPKIDTLSSFMAGYASALLRQSDEPAASLLSAEINALPERVRRFVHDLETRADPAGDVREAHVARETATALAARVEELERASVPPGECPHCETWKRTLEATEAHRKRLELRVDELEDRQAQPLSSHLDATGEPCTQHPYVPHVLPGSPHDRCHECGLYQEHPIHALTKSAELPRVSPEQFIENVANLTDTPWPSGETS